MQNKKGFTIIELIVVIAIIAILAAIVMVNVTQYIQKSKTASVQANLDTLKTNMIAYMADPAHDDASAIRQDVAASDGGPLCGSNGAIYKAIDANNGSDNFGSLPNCFGYSNVWCASAATVTPIDSLGHKHWCVDSTGYVGYGICQDMYVCQAGE